MSSHIHIRKSDQSPVTFPTNIIAQGALPNVTPIDSPPEGLQMGEHSTHLQGELYRPQGLYKATIDKLTDDALLEIFHFYLKKDEYVEKWHKLVHVCQRWRNIVSASPRSLDLQLLCTGNRPVRAMLDIWPTLPLMIKYNWMDTREAQDDVIAALEHHDRVREISLTAVPNPVWETLAAAMQVPFPELTYLYLWPRGRSVPALPDSFLGGSAPRLQFLSMRETAFLAVRNLLLSTSDLVHLCLRHIPHSGYISPETMVTCLSSLNRLRSLDLGFESPQSRPDRPSPPRQTRAVLSALTKLTFKGMVDYSEDLVARIDTPVLNQLYVVFFMDLVFDIPHFKQFIGRAKGLNPSKAANLWFDTRSIQLQLDQPHGLRLEVRCDRIDWQLDSMARVCGQLSLFFASIEQFDLIWLVLSLEPQGKDDMEPTQFLEIFQSFTAIQSLRVSRTLVPFIAPALQGLIGASATGVLPNLRDLALQGSAISGSIQEDIQPFIEARRLSGQPVAVLPWDGL